MTTPAQRAAATWEVEDRAVHFLNEIRAEWRDASGKHAPIGAVHEAAAVIKEEYDEFWDEVRRKKHDKTALRLELKQVAAMCLRAVVDLRLEDEQGE